MIKLEEGLERKWVPGLENQTKQMFCICGNPGTILYHHEGGWWCDKHSYIPDKVFQSKQLPLQQGIQSFIEFHN